MSVAVPDHLRRVVAAALTVHVRAIRDDHRARGGPPPAVADLIDLIRQLTSGFGDETPTITTASLPWLTTAEAARRLNISVQRVRQLADTGKLPAVRLGRTWAIREDHCGQHRASPPRRRRG